MKKKFKSILNCVILVITVCMLTMVSCREAKSHTGQPSQPQQEVINLDEHSHGMPVAIYKGHKHDCVPPDMSSCTPDCPKWRAAMKQIVTEVIDSINNNR